MFSIIILLALILVFILGITIIWIIAFERENSFLIPGNSVHALKRFEIIKKIKYSGVTVQRYDITFGLVSLYTH